MTTWNESALNKLNMFSRGLVGDFDGSVLSSHFNEISKCVRQNNTDDIENWVTSVGFEAARWLDQNGMWDVPKLQEILVAKQLDYGHENIMAFGIIGVGIRVCDKIARYYNLVNRPDEAENEPFVDCLVDMVGYAVIARMLQDDTFLLDLEGR